MLKENKFKENKSGAEHSEKQKIKEGMRDLPETELAYRCCRRLSVFFTKKGVPPEVYYTGGCLRDILLGREPKDIDIATSLSPDEIISLIPEAKHIRSKQAYPVVIVGGAGRNVEIATFRKDVYGTETNATRHPKEVKKGTIIDDAFRRDFTCNALYFNPLTCELIDLVGGLEDIKNKKLNFIGDADRRIKEDPLRLLRAVRFKNRFGFEYAAKTVVALQRNISALEIISKERIFQELSLMLAHPSRRQAIEDLDSFSFLEKILPEVTAGKGVKQPPEYHSEGDVWSHQLLILEQLGESPSQALAWAALLHDIGKKDRAEVVDGRVRFLGHDKRSAELVGRVAERLRFSKELQKQVEWLAANHMKVWNLPEMSRANQFKMMSHPLFEDLLLLCEADDRASLRSAGGGDDFSKRRSVSRLRELYSGYKEETKKLGRAPLPSDIGVDGRFAAEVLGISLSPKGNPELGRYMKLLSEKIMAGEIKDKKEARRFLLCLKDRV